MVVLGFSYVFAFLMVKEWAGLTPAQVSATYAPAAVVDESGSAGGVQQLDPEPWTSAP